VINILAIEFATTLVGAAVIESVFSLPGLGSLLVQSIAKHDYPSIQGVVVVSSLIVLGAGFLADVVQRLVDPRLTSSQASGRLP
jgi:peptide/nickel transport system permease protein